MYGGVMLVAVSLLVALAPIALAVQYINGWEVYTVQDGLAPDRVGRVFVDDNGLKWFAGQFEVSNGELCTFDDDNWGYFPDLGLVYDITADPHGDVWVTDALPDGPSQGGPRRFKDGAFEPPVGGEMYHHATIPTTLDFDQEGRLWVSGVGSGTDWTPFASNLELPAGLDLRDYELFTLTLPDLPEGTYQWHAALTDAGTMNFASNIACCPWLSITPRTQLSIE
jgi:hypothetical protein